MSEWSEMRVSRVLARNTFDGHLVLVPNCTQLGYEIDLLVVARNLKIIDVEVKVSAADLRADNKKSKWWRQPYLSWEDSRAGKPVPPREAVRWPRGVWKHYYAMPEAIWREDMRAHIQGASGVLLVYGNPGHEHVKCVKPSEPNPHATPITAAAAVNYARLASLRMWDTYKLLEKTA